MCRSLMEKPKGSNSIVTELSRVSRRTEIKFLIKEGETRTSWRRRDEEEVGTVAVPAHCTGKDAPLSTTMRAEEGAVDESIPELPAMCDEAPVSRSQSLALGGVDWRVRPVRAS